MMILPESPEGGEEALEKINLMIRSLKEDGLEPITLLHNLQYVHEALNHLLFLKKEQERQQSRAEEDELEELDNVTSDIKEWLTSTFATKQQPSRKTVEAPSLRSVANAIRTGKILEKIYSSMSPKHVLIFPDDVLTKLERVDDWNFEIFEFARSASGSPLKFLGYYLLREYGCFNKLKIPPATLETLLGHLEVGYACNGAPYHNNLHACDVLQTTHCCISQTGLKDWMSDLEIFSLLFSAIIHDYNHTGTTNNFHVQSTSDLAILYNDKSVLENHHVAAFFRTMIDNDCNIFGNLTQSEFQYVRTLLIDLVLGTDMTNHFTQIKTMKANLVSPNNTESVKKTEVMCLLLHSADVSHPTKEWELHKEWTARCMEEFFKQGDKERELGLDISPLCDRNTTQVPQSQIGFIDYIVSPLFNTVIETVEHVVGKAELVEENPWLLTVEQNRGVWISRAESCESLEPSTADQDILPPRVFRRVNNVTNGEQQEEEIVHGEEEELNVLRLNSLDNRHLIKQIGPIVINSRPPSKPTRHIDMVRELGKDRVISRPASPDMTFGMKDSITSEPPRPGTAWSHCLSPPERRRAPISVDHTLRKHALDFS